MCPCVCVPCPNTDVGSTFENLSLPILIRRETNLRIVQLDHVHWKHTCQHVYVYRHSCFWPSNAWDSWAVASDNDSTTGALEAAKLSSHGSSVLPQPPKITHSARMFDIQRGESGTIGWVRNRASAYTYADSSVRARKKKPRAANRCM